MDKELVEVRIKIKRIAPVNSFINNRFLIFIVNDFYDLPFDAVLMEVLQN